MSILTYFGKRRNGEIDTSFTLRSNASGRTIVHFYKKDVLTSSFIDDYLEVIISESIAPAGTRVEAPLYSEIVPPYQFDIPNPQDFKKLESVENIPAVQIQKEEPVKFDTEKNEANIILPEQNTNTSSKPVIEPAAKTIIKEVVKEIKVEEKKEILISDVPEVVLTEEIISDESVVEEQTLSDEGLKFLVDAQEAFYRQDYKAAANLLEQFFEVANTQLDSAFYLKGQIYEAKSDIQNIRTAISAYNQVVTEFPTSPFWQLAKNRQTYLNRFYFDIR